MEVYVDDLILKSKRVKDVPTDMWETSNRIRKMGIHLNPKKCVFGGPSRKILVFIVLEQEIEVDPEKIHTIQQMPPQKASRIYKKLSRCMAYLGRFLSKLGEKSLLFYQLLKGNITFEWKPELPRRPLRN